MTVFPSRRGRPRDAALPIRAMSVLLVIAVLFPKVAAAYVDPGVVGMLFQALFVFVFGFFLTVVTKPLQVVKRLLVKLGLRQEEGGIDAGHPEESPQRTNPPDDGD